jgi:hypothetical protein
MDSKQIDEFNAHAEKAAAKLGVGAAVRLVTMEASDVNNGGPHLELTVFREVAGRVQERCKHFRQEIPNLRAVIEEEIAVLASQFDATT